MVIRAWFHRTPRHRFGRRNRSSYFQSFQPVVLPLEQRQLPSTFTVTSINDSGAGSLRQALLDANADSDAISNIVFNIPGIGVQTLRPASALPMVTHSVVIDATSQPNYAGTPLIELDGSQAGATASGLVLAGGNSMVLGLDIDHFQGDAIRLQTNGGDLIQSNYIGIDVTGTFARANGEGIDIDGSNNNVVLGNVVSGNADNGVFVRAGATGNQIVGNYIGTDATGLVSVGNEALGVYVSQAPGNTVAGNVISGNRVGGVQINATTGTIVQGNWIGTDATGGNALANGLGLEITNASNNLIGGNVSGSLNVISGNTTEGILLSGNSTANQIQGNWIGTDASGEAALGNGTDGLFITGAAHGNTIGGTDPGAGNVIAANGVALHNGHGIELAGDSATGNLIQGNLIGTDAGGSFALGNYGDGVLVGASGNTIGGTDSGARNIISGNLVDGVNLFGSVGVSNTVAGNYIGTDITGTVAIPNVGHGVTIFSASSNLVGGTAAGAGNVISGNGDGVYITGANAAANMIEGNWIGTDASGLNPLGNRRYGVFIDGAENNFIGGLLSGAGNTIAANGSHGVVIHGSTATGNLIQGNFIGTATDGSTPLGNTGSGVFVDGGAYFNEVGGIAVGAANVIANNGQAGVEVTLGPSNSIRENSIVANANLGIVLHGASAPNLPVLTRATSTAQSVTIQGTYSGAAHTSYTLEFFVSANADPSGFGQGQTYLGTWTVMTDGSGTASFSVSFNVPGLSGLPVSATATMPNNTTSQFAQDVIVDGPTGPSPGGDHASLNGLAASLHLTADATPRSHSVAQSRPSALLTIPAHAIDQWFAAVQPCDFGASAVHSNAALLAHLSQPSDLWTAWQEVIG